MYVQPVFFFINFQEYKLALLQCYGQYLQQICKVDVDMLGLNVQQFQSHFFPNGFRDKTASRTVSFNTRDFNEYYVSCSPILPLTINKVAATSSDRGSDQEASQR